MSTSPPESKTKTRGRPKRPITQITLAEGDVDSKLGLVPSVVDVVDASAEHPDGLSLAQLGQVVQSGQPHPPPLAPLGGKRGAIVPSSPIAPGSIIHPLRPRQTIDQSVEPEPHAIHPAHWGLSHNYDETNKKKQKRLEQNRAAASASRTRKKLYLEKLEAENAELKKEIAELKLQLAAVQQAPADFPEISVVDDSTASGR